MLFRLAGSIDGVHKRGRSKGRLRDKSSIIQTSRREGFCSLLLLDAMNSRNVAKVQILQLVSFYCDKIKTALDKKEFYLCFFNFDGLNNYHLLL